MNHLLYLKQYLLLTILICGLHHSVISQVSHDNNSSTVTIKNGNGTLVLQLQYKDGCTLNNVAVMQQNVVSNNQGIFGAVKLHDKWLTTAKLLTQPSIIVRDKNVVLDNIVYGDEKTRITEKWTFNTAADYIDWTIERKYPGAITIEDTGFPQWSFDNMQTWTGALLGTGGVAWGKLFDRKNASLASHTGEVALFNQDNKSGLSIKPLKTNSQQVAVRFTRQPDDKWTLNYTASDKRTNTKHTLSRFIIDRQDIWDTLTVKGTATVSYRLTPFDYDKTYYRGNFPGFNGASIKSVLNTIARVGVIDEKIMGSNNWHLDAGYAVMHEQWIAQMGLGINDSNYLSNYQKTLDYYRDNAISADGRVKSRWAYNKNDAEPGTYDAKGFYEAQWGRLLDANTDQVINVAELFQMNGNLKWVRTHKASCEKVLSFLLRRDSDNDGLVEAMTDSYKEKRGSDWIDVIWASYETAFLNAEMYEALNQWAEVEQLLGDNKRAREYLAFALKLKTRFNQPVKDGGFWDPEKQWYVYWRDKDDRIHGSNLVTPVNFMAIAYGICDDKKRQEAVLGKIESLMQEQHLFMWPINFFPYEPDEGYKVNYPYPNYENGDIFLGWGETAVRAYQNYDPSIPIRYIKNVLAKYEKDGLAFQRYDRLKEEGQGHDILANNALAVVGLYRNIYGIQPKYNRLYLKPHMTEELNGTTVKYWLRGNNYMIDLSTNNYMVTVDSFSIRSSTDFGINAGKNLLEYFPGSGSRPVLKISRNGHSQVKLAIEDWKGEEKKWQVSAASAKLGFHISTLNTSASYQLLKDGKLFLKLKSDIKGEVTFTDMLTTDQPVDYMLKDL